MKGILSFVMLFAIIAVFGIFGLAIMQAGQSSRVVDDFSNQPIAPHQTVTPVVNQSAIGAQLEGPFAGLFGVFAIIAAVVLIVVVVLSFASGRSGR